MMEAASYMDALHVASPPRPPTPVSLAARSTCCLFLFLYISGPGEFINAGSDASIGQFGDFGVKFKSMILCPRQFMLILLLRFKWTELYDK